MANVSSLSGLGIALRALAVVGLAVGAWRAWPRGGVTTGERRFLVGLTIVVVLLVGGTLAFALLPA